MRQVALNLAQVSVSESRDTRPPYQQLYTRRMSKTRYVGAAQPSVITIVAIVAMMLLLWQSSAVAQNSAMMTLAESSPGAIDGTGSNARFRVPISVAVDASGNVYVADYYSHTIRKISASGEVSTLAGLNRATGSTNGTGSTARFDRPWGVAIDATGNVIVTDFSHSVRRISSAGRVTSLAGGSMGHWDGTGAAAGFWEPRGVAVDASGNVYVADCNNRWIRKISPAGKVTTLARLEGRPIGVAVDATGNVFFTGGEPSGVGESPSDPLAGKIGRISPTGALSFLLDAAGSAIQFDYLDGVAVDTNGNVYVAEVRHHTIWKVSPAGVVTTLAGSGGASGSTDGFGSAARFNTPAGVAVDTNGIVYVADTNNNTIRRISPAGEVTTLAGLAGSGRPDGPLSSLLTADDPPGFAGATHQLGFSGFATSYAWRVTRIPTGSSPVLSSASAAAPTFTPDVDDAYEIQLVANDGVSSRAGYLTLSPPTLGGTRSSLTERNATVPITVTLSEPLPSPVTADWATVDGTATAGTDYVAAGGSLTLDPGETSTTIDIQLLDDSTDEVAEWFAIDFSNVSNALDASLRIELDGRDLLPSITIDDVTVAEGAGGQTNATFRVRLSRSNFFPLTLSYTTKDGAARAGSDYTPAQSFLTFAAGETSKFIVVSVFGDSVAEPDETFSVVLGGVNGATFADSEGICTILDDDTQPRRRPTRPGSL